MWQVSGTRRIKKYMDNEQPQFELTESAFLTLLVKHEPSLRVYARSLVPDWDLVDEALQEASVTMWQKREQLESLDGFVPWARVILRFKCLRQVEKLRVSTSATQRRRSGDSRRPRREPFGRGGCSTRQGAA